MTRIWLRYTGYLPDICLIYGWDISERYLIYIGDMPDVYLNYYFDRFNTYQISVLSDIIFRLIGKHIIYFTADINMYFSVVEETGVK